MDFLFWNAHFSYEPTNWREDEHSKFKIFKKSSYIRFKMISSNALSTFILHHDLNEPCDKNLHSIQYLMCTGKSASDKFKRVSKYFPNMDIHTKSATPGNIQLTFAHTSVHNNPLGNPLLPSPSQGRFRHRQLSPLTPRLLLTSPMTRFGSLSLRYSFVLLSATSPDQTNGGTGWH